MSKSSKPKPGPAISGAEWEVMKVVWDREPVGGPEVVAALGDARGWKPRTVKTLLSRLLGKGAVVFDVDGKRHVYRSKVSRADCVRRESRSFLERVFDGAITPAVAHLLEGKKLSEEDVRRLQKVLEDGKQGKS